jgi:CBS domain-containing protein
MVICVSFVYNKGDKFYRIYRLINGGKTMTTTVKQLLSRKGDEICSTHSGASVFEALKIMAEKGIGALLVFDQNQLTGIISERDYARKVILKGKTSLDTTVGEIMTRKVLVVKPSQSLHDCMALMTEKRIRHLPVVEDDTVIGVISIGDVVKEIILEQEFVIDQLENYITGGC